MKLIESLVLGLKREYWEHRRMVLWIPIIFSMLLFLGSAAVTVSHQSSHQSTNAIMEETTAQQQEPDYQKGDAANALIDVKKMQQRIPIRFSFFYLALAWLLSIFYLLSSFYSDRKDNSVLYWKSLPVSESQNAMCKLVFAVLCIPIIALLIGWVLYILLTALGLGAMQSADGASTWQFVERTFDARGLIVLPLIGIFAGLLWGLPMFCYSLMVSAIVKRSPILIFIMSLLALGFIESTILPGSYLTDFISNHSPFGVLETLASAPNLEQFFTTQFTDKALSLFAGLVLASIFLAIAIWYRNHRFEI